MRANGELSQDEFLAKKSILDAEKKQIEDLTTKQKKSAGDADSETVRTLTFAQRALATYEKGDSRTRRDLIYELGSNLSLNFKILNIDAQKPFKILKKAVEKIPDLKPTLEPTKSPIDKKQNAQVLPARLTWLTNWYAYSNMNWKEHFPAAEHITQELREFLKVL